MEETKPVLALALKDTEAVAKNLDGIKTEFIRSNAKLKEFCTLYPEMPWLNQRATQDGWLAQRKAFRESISLEAQKKIVTRGADYEAKLDGMVHRASKNLTRLVSTIVTQAAELAAQKDENGRTRLTLDDLPKIRSGIEALEKTYRLTRITAHLTPEPVPAGKDLDLTKLDHEERVSLAKLLLKAKRGEDH